MLTLAIKKTYKKVLGIDDHEIINIEEVPLGEVIQLGLYRKAFKKITVELPDGNSVVYERASDG